MQAAARHHGQLALRLPVETRTVGIGRRAAAQFAEETGCGAATLWRVRLAVSEALSNVVLHAHAPGEEAQRHLVLLAESDDRAVSITISDDGCGLRARIDSPGLGLGLALITSSCDELALDTGSQGGLCVRMTFLR